MIPMLIVPTVFHRFFQVVLAPPNRASRWLQTVCVRKTTDIENRDPVVPFSRPPRPIRDRRRAFRPANSSRGAKILIVCRTESQRNRTLGFALCICVRSSFLARAFPLNIVSFVGRPHGRRR